MVKKQKQIFNSSDFGYKQPLGQVLVANISFILSCGPEKCFYLCFLILNQNHFICSINGQCITKQYSGLRNKLKQLFSQKKILTLVK